MLYLDKVSVLQQTWNLIRTSGALSGGSGGEQNPHQEPHCTEVPWTVLQQTQRRGTSQGARQKASQTWITLQDRLQMQSPAGTAMSSTAHITCICMLTIFLQESWQNDRQKHTFRIICSQNGTEAWTFSRGSCQSNYRTVQKNLWPNPGCNTPAVP